MVESVETLGDNEGWPVDEAGKIRRRLAEFVEIKFGGNWSALAEATGVSVQTVQTWKPDRAGWPKFQNLLGLVRARLSLDWLVRGDGSMELQRLPTQTDVGRLLDALKPILQRRTGVRELSAEQAWELLLFGKGANELLEVAAQGFLPKYREIVRDLQRRDDYNQLFGWLDSGIRSLRHQVSGGDAQAIRAVLEEMLSRIQRSIPGYLLLNGNEDARQELMRRAALRDIDDASHKLAEEEKRGWSPGAITTAEDVADEMREVQRALHELAQLPTFPVPAVREILVSIESALTQLVGFVGAQQAKRVAVATEDEDLLASQAPPHPIASVKSNRKGRARGVRRKGM